VPGSHRRDPLTFDPVTVVVRILSTTAVNSCRCVNVVGGSDPVTVVVGWNCTSIAVFTCAPPGTELRKPPLAVAPAFQAT
jgi:hypothetical protein